MDHTPFINQISLRFDTGARGWKGTVCKALDITRPTLDRYIAIDQAGESSRIPGRIWQKLGQPVAIESERIDSPYVMVNLLAEGLGELQESIDRLGHILAPYPPALSRGLNLAAAWNLEHGKSYPTSLAGLLSVATKPLYTWCPEYEGEGAEEFGAAVLVRDGEVTPDCLAIARLGDTDPETYFYKSLMDACSELDDSSAQRFYVAWRRMVIEHPVADSFTVFLNDPSLRNHLGLTQRLAEVFYEPLTQLHSERNAIPVCPISGTRIKKIRGEWVSEYRDPRAAATIRQNGPSFRPFFPGMLELKRPARIFWALPGLHEIDLFKTAQSLGYQAELWPRMDTVDLIISHPNKPLRFAIDIKEHRSPVGLARAFEGFKFFKRHQLAIVVPDYLCELNPDYLKLFERARRAYLKSKVQILMYSTFLQMLEENQ